MAQEAAVPQTQCQKHQCYPALQQSIETNEEKTTQSIAEAEARFQNVKKENEILELESENAKIQRQKNTMMAFDQRKTQQ